MKNQTIENMGVIVHKLRQSIITEVFEDNYKHESTQVAKTLINTYQTMLNTFMQMTSNKFKEANVQKDLEKQAEDIYNTINAIEIVTIPKLIEANEFRGVDNLSVVVDKARRIIGGINPRRDFSKEIKQPVVSDNTKALLELSIATETLIYQSYEALRGTGKTTSIVKEADKLNCAILTMNKVTMHNTFSTAKELGLHVTVIPATELNYTSLPQYKEQIKNGFLVDDVRELEVLHKLKDKGYKILGGFIA